MTPSRILVTGASGFVGGFLLTELRARWPEAELFTTFFDITVPEAAAEAVRAAAPEACIHLAAISSVGRARQDMQQAFAVNLRGTLNLARAILELAPECRLIHAGSAESYGASFRQGEALDESAPLAPLNLYAASKAAADLALGALAAESGLRVLRFRAFNHTGPGQSIEFVTPAFAAQIASIERGAQPPVIETGDLGVWRDFLDVRDVVRAYALALERFETMPQGAVFNLASGTPHRISTILEALIAASGLEIEVRVDPARLRPVDLPYACGDAGAAAAALGWAPEIPFESTLAAVLAHARREG